MYTGASQFCTQGRRNISLIGLTAVVYCRFLSGWRPDTRLARCKLVKQNTPRPWRPPSPYGRHGSPPPAPPHTTINQHDCRQVYAVKSRGFNCFYYLLAMYWHNASSMRRVCVCLLRRLPLADLGQRKIAVTHPCSFDCRFRMAEPGRTVMGVRYCWRRKPCLVCFLGVASLGIL